MQLILDNYIIVDEQFEQMVINNKREKSKPYIDWPETLSEEEKRLDWHMFDFWYIDLEKVPFKIQ